MTQQLTYERVYPNANYAPWLADTAFQEAFAQIASSTMVDSLRCYELWQLVAQAVRLPGDILEVGVWRGGTGCLMARRVQIERSPAKLFLCDTFTGVVKAGAKDDSYNGGEHADTSIDMVNTLVREMALTNVETLTGIFPDETGAQVADRRFSLCHIDVDVYESARDVLDWVWPRMPAGGVVVYDDYGFDTCSGVTRIVNERLGESGTVVLHNLNGHAVVVKTREEAAPGFWKRIFS